MNKYISVFTLSFLLFAASALQLCAEPLDGYRILKCAPTAGSAVVLNSDNSRMVVRVGDTLADAEIVAIGADSISLSRMNDGYPEEVTIRKVGDRQRIEVITAKPPETSPSYAPVQSLGRGGRSIESIQHIQNTPEKQLNK